MEYNSSKVFYYDNIILVQTVQKKGGNFHESRRNIFQGKKYLMSSSIETSLVTYCTNVNWQDPFL
jgi:hypothetical protein